MHKSKNDEIGFGLSNFCYEHAIPVSKNVLSKRESIAIAISVGFFYLGFCCRNGVSTDFNGKLIGLVLFLSIFVRLLRRIFWGVRTESILIVKTFGLQKTTIYHSNLKSSVFIPWHSINDVIINEAIVMQKVIFYLAVLVKSENQEKAGESIIPLFIYSQPRLAELKKIYTKIQLILND